MTKFSLRAFCRWIAIAVAGLTCFVDAGRAAQTTAEQWGIFEIELKGGPTDGNPFTDVRLSAVFTNNERTVEIAGFYDGDGTYRVRFMPDRVGSWRYETKSNRWPLTGQVGAFTVTPPSGKNHGPVRVHNTYHFAHADGTPFKQIGTTIYNWTQAPEEWQEVTLKTLASAPFNKIRMLLTAQDQDYAKRYPTPRFPFEGTPPQKWDFTRFNPAFFQHLEQRLGQLRDLGIEADVILFHPYGKRWGFDTMDAESDARWVRYVIARLASYRNIWWSLSNEYDFLRTKTEADWDRIFQIVQASDPYAHLRSIHNGFFIYDHNKPWVTHASIQNGSAVEESGRAQIYRDVYRKPIVYDEVKYEGDNDRRWGNLTAQEMVHRFWCGTVAGTYVGHGDYYLNAEQDTWVSYGGILRGQSHPRLAFLRKIMEEGPAEGIDPIDKWQDTRVGGKAGDYYLFYFGREAPTSWPFQLYKNGLADGLQFKVEIIDTWNMTITPVEGVFVTKTKDSYHFIDAQNRAVTLPGKPYMALRVQRIGGTPTLPTNKPMVE